MKLMTKMLKDIETKVLIIEDMERDTNCMLSRADHLQMKTRFLEDLQKNQLVAKSEKVPQKPTSSSSEQVRQLRKMIVTCGFSVFTKISLS